MQTNILEWLENTVKEFGDKTAFSDTENSISFDQVISTAKSIGTAIAERNIINKPIAVISGRHCYTPCAFLGVVYSGNFYAPIDGTLPVARINQIIETLDPALILTDSQNLKMLDRISYSCSTEVIENINQHEIDQKKLDCIRRFSNESDPLYIIFTSGSTGRPKGVITSHHSLMCYIDAYSDVLKIDSSDILGNQSPLDYIAAIRDIYLPVKHGCSTVIIPKSMFSSPALLFDYMTEKKVSSVGWSVSALTVPVALNAFDHGKPEYLKKVCFSGSVMSCKVLKIWQENLPETVFVNQYGPTEATASCTYYVVENKVNEDDVLPIGYPYKDYKVFILNENNEYAAVGEKGEICVSGPALALGYYNDHEKTEKSFIQNPVNKSYRELIYRTGDIGLLREDGILEFHGRMDRQIKFLGHRVELDEVEGTAMTLAGVDECCVVYNKDKELIILYYSGEATAKEIAIEMRKSLPGFMIPRKMIKLDAIPKLPNGKTDIIKLKNM